MVLTRCFLLINLRLRADFLFIKKYDIIIIERKVMKMNKIDAFRIVYNELIEYPVFAGHYDAKHGNEHYIHGINTVMSVIASHAGYFDEFEQLFAANMLDSEKRAGKE